MRRAVPAGIATALGLIALLSFKSSPVTISKAASAQSVTPTTPAATAPPTSSSGSSSADTTPTTTPTTSTTPTTGATATRTIDGDPFDNQYGTVQVQVTLQGSTITNVTTLQMPFEHQRSAEISQQAAPMLQQEVLQAQSAQIDLIGGATYTSQSYAQSLQSALDKA